MIPRDTAMRWKGTLLPVGAKVNKHGEFLKFLIIVMFYPIANIY